MKLPDELKELKLRLQFELDSDITDRVIDQWYKEYQDDYEKLIGLYSYIANAEDIKRPARNDGIVNANDGLESADTSTEKDETYWRNWALQNIS